MKKTILLIGLGVAFVAVSAWVLLSGGRSARAVRAKFRLGGAILTLTSAMAATGCVPSCYDRAGEDPSENLCYDPAPPTPENGVAINDTVSSSLRNGDIVLLDAYCEFESEATITLVDCNNNELQREVHPLMVGQSSIEVTIAAGEYLGAATVNCQYERKPNMAYVTKCYITIVE